MPIVIEQPIACLAYGSADMPMADAEVKKTLERGENIKQVEAGRAISGYLVSG